jgi:hypothetical protein
VVLGAAGACCGFLGAGTVTKWCKVHTGRTACWLTRLTHTFFQANTWYNFLLAKFRGCCTGAKYST